MIYTKPYFFDDFKCKADKCIDTCCAGWEVDIDAESFDVYKNINGKFGRRLMDNIIDVDGLQCFRLCENDRCSFLAKNGLCDIYTELGEEYLCEICREHPRFYDFFDGVTEMGLGLCCEKVCEMIFSSTQPITFISTDIDDANDIFDDNDKIYFAIREKCFEIIYNREESLKTRFYALIEYCISVQNSLFNDTYKLKAEYNIKDLFTSVLNLFADTEPIDGDWTDFIEEMKNNFDVIYSNKELLKINECNYEQFLTYVIYRHFMKSRFSGNILEPICFGVISLIFVFLSDIRIFLDKNNLTFNDKIDNIKRWSKQIEYSQENTQMILDSAAEILLDSSEAL